MEGHLEPATPGGSHVLASDEEREGILVVVREAMTTGRLTLDEFTERAERALVARTRGDLAPIVGDLPAESRPAVPRPQRDTLVIETQSGSRKERGTWLVPPRIIATSMSGSIHLDFTRAECAESDVTIVATCKSGSIRLIVPRGWAVVLEDVKTKSGSVRNRASAPRTPGAPVLHIYGSVVSGSIRVRHPIEWFRRRRRTR